MQNSNAANVTWTHRPQLDDGGESDAWPQLNQETQSRQFKCKNTRCIGRALPPDTQGNNESSLDEVEYPLLGVPSARSRELMTPEKFDVYSPRTELIPAVNRFDGPIPKRCRSIRGYKRVGKCCVINLEEVLTKMWLKNANPKEAVRLNVNFPVAYQNRSVSQALSNTSNSCVKRIHIRISGRRPSRLKRIILTHRDMRAQINMRKPQVFDEAQASAIASDLNDINFSSLRITADPEIDVDYVRGMSSLNFYGKEYRPEDPAFSGDTVIHGSDIIDKLNELHIQNRRQLCETRAINSVTVVEEDSINSEILERTLNLGIDDDDKREIKDCAISNDQATLTHSRNFREYCTNLLTPGLNESLEKFLRELVRLQRRHYDKDQNKARYRRRYYSGLKEVQKHVELRKVKFVIVAPDIEKVDLTGGLDDQVYKLIDACKQQNVVYCFGLRRRKLGYYTHGNGFVGSIGISNYEGTEEMFKNVLIELVVARNELIKRNGDAEIPIDLAKLNPEDCLMSESITMLMRFLSPSICKIERQ